MGAAESSVLSEGRLWKAMTPWQALSQACTTKGSDLLHVH